MKILALNCGSSTVKFQLFETGPELIERDQDRALARGTVERVGAPESPASFQAGEGGKRSFTTTAHNHQEAIHTALACLVHPGGPLRDLQEIDGAGHRMVYIGDRFRGPVRLDEEARTAIEAAAHLAPLHTPHNLRGYLALRAELPSCPNVAVFDSAFHHSIPPRAYLFGLPYEVCTDLRIRQYGYHGISHQYVFERYCRLRRAAPDKVKVITCHLGSGCSMCAIDRGQSVDTSLGFSPLGGLMMGTRPGDLDPGALLHLMAVRGLDVAQAHAMLNQRSGLLGLSGLSNDMRELDAASRKGHERARLAIEVFCYRIKKYLGSFCAVLNGCDAIIFTGGIGEHRPLVRAMACADLGALGIAIDPDKNEAAVGREAEISGPGGSAEVWVIPTNEELLIARHTVQLVTGGPPAPAPGGE